MVCSPGYTLLMLLWSCSALRKCVLWSVLIHVDCWYSCALVLPPVCVWCILFCTICAANAHVALFCLQDVCDVVCSLPYGLLMLLLPCSALRQCVLWSVLHHMCYWCSCGLILLSESVWWSVLHYMDYWCSCGLVLPSDCVLCDIFCTKFLADTLMALFCLQKVSDVVCWQWIQCWSGLWHCFTLRLYVT